MHMAKFEKQGLKVIIKETVEIVVIQSSHSIWKEEEEIVSEILSYKTMTSLRDGAEWDSVK